MKILLVNNNQVVQKLIDVTTKKVDCDLTTLGSFKDFEKEKDLEKYDLIVFDQEILDEYKGDFSFLSGITSLLLYSQTSQDNAMLGFFTYTIKKPFLPNEFLNLLVSTKQKIQEKQKEEFANLDEKAMFASIDAEDEADEDDEDLNALLKGLNISSEEPQEIQEEKDDDLDALLQELPEEEELEEERAEGLEGVGELESVGSPLRRDEELSELDAMQEEDIEEAQDEGDVAIDFPVSEIIEEKEEKEDEYDELSKILDDDLVDEDDKHEDEPSVGGALDLTEIQKVQNLLNEVQKSGSGESHVGGELELLQTLLSSRSPEGIREILDGMQLTINISFPKKEH